MIYLVIALLVVILGMAWVGRQVYADLREEYEEKLLRSEEGVDQIMESYDNDLLDAREKIARYEHGMEMAEVEIDRLASLLASRNGEVNDLTLAVELFDAELLKAKNTRP